MVVINKNISNNKIQWTILKGMGSDPENFTGSTMTMYITTENNKIPVQCRYIGDGTLEADIHQDLATGEYGVDLIWIKNDHTDLGSRCINRTHKENVFKIATTGVLYEQTVKLITTAYVYGYDGLNSYELAVLRGYWDGDETSWLKHQRYVDVYDELGESITGTISQKVISENINRIDDTIDELDEEHKDLLEQQDVAHKQLLDTMDSNHKALINELRADTEVNLSECKDELVSMINSINRAGLVIMQGTGNSTEYAMSQKAITEEFNNIRTEMAVLHGTIGVNVSVSPNVIWNSNYQGGNTDVTVSCSTKNNKQATTITLSGGAIPSGTSKNNTTSISKATSVGSTTTYTGSATLNGATVSGTATVTAVYPIYIGLGSAHTDIVNSSYIQSKRTSASGTYTLAAKTSNSYVWIVTTYNVNSATAGGFDYPLTKQTDILLYNTTYHVYRGSNDVAANNSVTITII